MIRKLSSLVVAWFAIGGLGVALMQRSIVIVSSGLLLFLFGSVSSIALWRGASWGKVPLLVFGIAGVLLPIALLTSVRTAIPPTAWIALLLGGAIFFGISVVLGRLLNRPSPPAA